MKKKLLILLVWSFSISGHSQENNNSTTLDKSFFITFGYRNGFTKINHNETSSDSTSGFNSLNNTSKITNNIIELGAMKEFYSSSKWSISVMTNAGIHVGNDKATIKKSNIIYSDKLSGNHYSFGGSVNFNFEAYKLKIQPFGYSSVAKINTKTILNYNQGTINPITIRYKTNSQVTDIGAGIRFLDAKVKLMSYFSVSYSISNNIATGASSLMNNSLVGMSSYSSIFQRPLTFSLGFGFWF